MIKKLLISLVLFSFGLTVTWAAAAAKAPDDTSNGKAVAITGNLVRIEIEGDLAAWIRKGAYVRAVTQQGALILRGAKVTVVEGKTITVQTAMAKDVKAGETYKLSKGKPTAGC